MQVLGRSWADAGQLQTFLHHSEAWSRPREARPKTTDWEPVSGQRLGRSLEVPGLGRAGQMLEVWGWRFWRDLVRCWPHVFNLGALPVPCQDRFMKIAFWGVFFRGLFSLVFGKRFGAQKVPRRTPKSSPGAAKMAPREAPGPFPKRVPKKVDFWSFWGVPGTSKIELSLKRELDFHFFTLLRFWTPNGSKNGAKMEPEWSQNQLGGGLGGFPEPSQTLSKKSFEK